MSSAITIESLPAVAEAARAGEHVSLRYSMRSGIQSSLFLTVEPGGTFAATYGPNGFPLPKTSGITVTDLIHFVTQRCIHR